MKNRSSPKARVRFSWENSTVRLQACFLRGKVIEKSKLQLTGSTEKTGMFWGAVLVGSSCFSYCSLGWFLRTDLSIRQIATLQDFKMASRVPWPLSSTFVHLAFKVSGFSPKSHPSPTLELRSGQANLLRVLKRRCVTAGSRVLAYAGMPTGMPFPTPHQRPFIFPSQPASQVLSSWAFPEPSTLGRRVLPCLTFPRPPK